MEDQQFSVLHYIQVVSEGNVILDFLGSLLEGKNGTVDLIFVTEETIEIHDEERKELAQEQQQRKEAVTVENVKDAKDKLEEKLPKFTINALSAAGDPVEEVLRRVRDKRYDLLSLEAFGRGGFRKNILGAHVNKIVQEETINIPTLIHKGKLPSCERVLLPVPNNKKRCQHLISYAIDLLGNLKPAITFLIVISEEWEKFEGYTPEREEHLLESMQDFAREEFDYLDIAQEMIEEEGLEAEVRYRVGETPKEILKEAKEGRYDLMMFSPQKPNILSSLWSGDKSLKVMRDIEISILRLPEPIS